MIHGTLVERQLCPVHPNRRATHKCGRCMGRFCADCLEELDGRLLCERCHREVTALAKIRDETRFTPRNLVRRIFRKEVFIGAVVILAVAGAIGVFVSFFWRSAGTDVDFLLIRRVRVGFTQSFDMSGEGFDFAEVLNEGKASASSQSQEVDHELERLIDGLPDEPVPAWRSADAAFPIEIVLEASMPRPLAKLVLWSHLSEDTTTFIRDFEVWTSPVDPAVDRSKLELVGKFTAGKVTTAQRFLFDPPVPTLFTLVKVLSSYGSPAYISAAEIGLFSSPESAPLVGPMSAAPLGSR